MTPEELAQQQQQQQEQQQQQTQTQTNDSNTDNVRQLMQEVLGQSEREKQALLARTRELEDQILRFQQPQNVQTQVPQNQQVDNNTFWQQPADNLRNMIHEQVRPILEVAADLQRERVYNNLKSQYRQYPDFARLEPLVDKYMTGREVSHQNLQAAIREAIGELVLSGGFNQQQPPQNTQQQQPPQSQQTPPQTPPQAHLRPTQSQLQQQRQDQQKPQRRQLTELEKRLAREAKLSDDEYLDLLEQSNQVTNWKK